MAQHSAWEAVWRSDHRERASPTRQRLLTSRQKRADDGAIHEMVIRQDDNDRPAGIQRLLEFSYEVRRRRQIMVAMHEYDPGRAFLHPLNLPGENFSTHSSGDRLTTYTLRPRVLALCLAAAFSGALPLTRRGPHRRRDQRGPRHVLPIPTSLVFDVTLGV